MPSSPLFDLVVLGGGSAGFNAARVAQGLGRSVAIIDGGPQLGGLCILRGCMPSKTLLHVTDVLHETREAGRLGLRVGPIKVDLAAIQRRKREVIADFAGFREKQMQSGKYTLLRSQARFLDPHTVELDDGTQVRGKHFLIATGSRVSVPPLPGLAETPFWTSDDVLELEKVPRRVIVLGGGIVACELAQYLRRLGTEVVQVQRSAQLLRGFSPEAGAVVAEVFRREGIELHLGTRILNIRRRAKQVEVFFTSSSGHPFTVRGDHLFNALGREPNVDDLNLEAAGVTLNEDGRVRTNRWQQTRQPHIYAGGDVAGPHDIVHLAVAQGELAARHLCGVKGLRPVAKTPLLSVAFTAPAVARVGLNETELAALGSRVHSASYPFNDHGKSILMNALDGYVKVWAAARSGRLLAAEIVGPQAGELIHILSGPLALGATVFDLLKAPWYHPTLAEILTYPLEEIAEQISG